MKENFSGKAVPVQPRQFGCGKVIFTYVADDFDETMTNPNLCLDKIPPPPIEVNKPIVLENVYYDFNKATLKPESYPSLDSLVGLLNWYPKMVIEVSAGWV